MDATIDRVRKSEKLTVGEKKIFLEWVDNQPTKLDAALLLNISRPTLDRVIHSGSGSPETIAKIKTVINAE